MDSFLDVDATHTSSTRNASRKAAVLSSTRYQQSLHKFVAGSYDDEEFSARLGLVQDDLKEIVTAACDETGFDDVDGIVASINLAAKQHWADRFERKDKDSVSDSASKPWDDEEESEEDEEKKEAAVKTAAGTPIPKMDKRKWTPKSLGELPKDKADGPHPTVRQDVTDRVVPTNEEKLDQIGEQVTEHQDVTKKVENIKGEHTKTFPKGNQANPVTSAAQDVGRNPIQEILDQQQAAQQQFVDPTEAQRIIALHNAR